MDTLPLLRHIANRAATLTERLAARTLPSNADVEELDGRAVIDAWRAAIAAPSDEAFAARLSWQDLTYDSAVAAASRQVYSSGPLPAWTSWLRLALDEARHLADELDAGQMAGLPASSSIEEPPFVELGLPWLRVARRALAGHLPPDAPALPLGSLEAQLLREFGIYAGATLHHVFTHNLDDGAEAGTRAYDRFVLAMLRGGLWALFDAYPVVARQLSTIVESWVTTTAELCVRLSRDRGDLEEVFCEGRSAGDVVAVEPALSDPHDGRRRVATIRFSDGLLLVYKPRDLAVESAFFQVLAWARAAGLAPSQRTLRVLTRDGYGWVEYAAAARGFEEDDARRYYRQAGGLLCWAYVFRGRDLHMENVVATPAGPVLIDLEVLLQPVRADELPFWSGGGTASCLQSGLLTMVNVGDDGEPIDVGGLRGRPTSVGSATTRVWRHLRSDAITRATEAAPPARVANAVVVDGQQRQPEHYRDEVVAGFARTYRFILDNRGTMLAHGGPLTALAEGRVRILPRNTHQYAQLLQALNTPRYQADGAVRSAWLDILARPHLAAGVRPDVWPLLHAEHRQLENLDVPRFWASAQGTTVFAGDHPVMDHYIAISGLEAVRRQIASLSAGDLDAQQARLADALTSTVETRFSVRIEPPAAALDGTAVGVTLCATAMAIGEELVARRLTAGGRIGAAGSLQAHTLYAGLMGSPVFFAALAAATGDGRWRTAAETAVEPVLDFVRSRVPPREPEPAGICAGTGSLVYGLGLVGRLLQSPACVEMALAAAARLTPDNSLRDAPDLTDGWAGAILALTSAFDLAAEPALLAQATDFAECLLAMEVRTPAGSLWPVAGGRRFLGFAHGSAGIGTAALALARLTGDERWRALGERAWQALESSFLPSPGNWPIEHASSGRGGTMTAWCHGSPGILIGLGRALDFGCESAILTHANAAWTTLQRVPDHLEEHLCCGNLGRAEALLCCGLRVGAPAVVESARASGMRVAERAARRQHVRLAAAGFEYPVFDPGFFRGLSGVGYQLLRLAAPSTIPSALGFA